LAIAVLAENVQKRVKFLPKTCDINDVESASDMTIFHRYALD